MTITLRPYQAEAIQRTYDWMRAHDGNPLIVLPTGTGKSVVLTGIIRDALQSWDDTRILVLSHVRELLTQDFAALMRAWPEAPAGIYSAGLNKRDINAQVLVAGIQSIHKRAYEVQRCDLVFIDEAHLIGRSDAGMYRRFLKDLREINPNLRVIGLSATPYRLDTGLLYEGENALFDGVAYQAPLLKMIEQGYLCPVISRATDTVLNVAGVGTRGGEFIAAELEAAVDIDSVTQAAVDEIVRKGEDRGSWLLFCSGVKHAMHVRDEVRKWNISCEMVSGETPTAERDRIMSAFNTGHLRAVTNMNCLTTGIDVPGIDLIAMLRPTKSLSLHVQMLGRGMRLAEGKEECICLDFANNTRLHGPIDLADGRRKGAKGDGIPPTKTCPNPECKAIVAASAHTCPACGHEFPPPEVKIDSRAGNAPVLSIHAVTEWASVTNVRYSRHEKEGKPPSMLVTYQCGLALHREWICLQHTGYPRQKAAEWWAKRAPGAAVPSTVDQALEQADDLPKPTAISVRPVGRYTEITGVKFT